MNLQKKRLVRTAQSEQYALFDVDQTDADLNPLSIGKLDLHFTAEGTYGTLLLWQETLARWDEKRRQYLIDAILADLSGSMGVSPDYAIELFTPPLSSYALHSNMAEEGEPAAGESAAEEEQTDA